MKLITCDVLVGLPRVPDVNGVRNDMSDLVSELDRLRIDYALVRHRACLDNDPYWGNSILMDEIKGQNRIQPVWALTPDGEGPDFDPVVTIRAMLMAGVKMSWMSPGAHGYSPAPWCCSEIYNILTAACVPLLMSYEEIGADALDTICEAFPQLRVILTKVPRLGRNRMLYPLLRRHANLHVCFDPTFSVHEGYRDLCDTFGSHRWMLGTGYPDAEGGSGIAGLMYANLNDEELNAVAYENIERLLMEVNNEF